MKTGVIVIIFLLSLVPFSASAAEYLLRQGDILSISIVSFADISGDVGTTPRSGVSGGLGFGSFNLTDVIVRPDGKLAIPLVGEIQVEGLSPSAVSAVIVERLDQYLVEPARVTINLTKVHTTRVYVLGEVNHPGLFELDISNNLVDALAMAGGWTKDAAKKKVFIIRKNMQSDPIKINLLDVLEKGDTRKNIILNYGDIVYLSSNGRIDFVRDIMPFVSIGYEFRNL